jgi:Uma2 family endonuclease
MATTVVFEERIEIPLGLRSLDEFRRWALSAEFPQRGRIDFLTDRIEVDMSPEDLFCHGVLKVEINTVLYRRVKQRELGHLFVDSTRVSCPDAGLSVEPDVVFVSHQSLDTGRVRLVPQASGAAGRYVELEGPPDLIVEIVSDNSVRKDTERLPAAYFQAGVREFWLADARGRELAFQIHRRDQAGYQPVLPDAEGFQQSSVFSCGFRLDRQRDARGNWKFDLLLRE